MDIVERLTKILDAVVIGRDFVKVVNPEAAQVEYLQAALDAFTIRVKCETCGGRGKYVPPPRMIRRKCLDCVDGYVETGLIETVGKMVEEIGCTGVGHLPIPAPSEHMQDHIVQRERLLSLARGDTDGS